MPETPGQTVISKPGQWTLAGVRPLVAVRRPIGGRPLFPDHYRHPVQPGPAVGGEFPVGQEGWSGPGVVDPAGSFHRAPREIGLPQQRDTPAQGPRQGPAHGRTHPQRQGRFAVQTLYNGVVGPPLLRREIAYPLWQIGRIDHWRMIVDRRPSLIESSVDEV